MAAPDTSQMPFVVISTMGFKKYAVVDVYQAGRSIKLGKAIIAMASVGICFVVSGMAVQSEHRDWNPYYIIASGMWCPIFYFLAGGFGIGTARRNSVCMVRTNLAMCIMSAMAGLTDVAMASLYLPYDTPPDMDEVTIAMMIMSGCCSLVIVCLSIALGHLSGPLVCNGLLIIPLRGMNVARTNQSAPREDHQDSITATQRGGTPGNAASGVDNMLMQMTSTGMSAVPNVYSPQLAMHVSDIARVSGTSEYEEVNW